MIRIGLTENQKKTEINKYVQTHPVKTVIVFSPPKFMLDLPDLGDVPIRQIEYNEVIMYRTFYPLLEEIGPDHLLVVNEFMRTRNRNDLTYNCLRHYLNQCGHTMVFEYLPFVEEANDFMILLDFDTKSKHKGFGFQSAFLEEGDILCQPHRYRLNVQTVPLPDDAQEEYERKKEELFDNLGNKDPDTVPRQLHVFCGRWKRPMIEPEREYVARNARFSRPNVTTFPKAEPGHRYIMLDFPHRRMDMNDFLRRTGMTSLYFLSTGLSVDQFYIGSFEEWRQQLEDFYAQAGIYAGNG